MINGGNNMLENKEIWKDIKGYEGLYQISNTGRVWSVQRQKYLMAYIANGYYKVDLYAKNGKRKKEYVHRLVALAFIDNPNNLPQVNHIDGNKINDNVENLEWVTVKENMYHSYHTLQNTKGCYEGMPVYCVEMDRVFKSGIEAARYLGKNKSSNICNCCENKYGYKTAYGYHWKWADISD